MKRGLILVLIFLVLFITKVNSESITGSTITGNATSGSVAVSITVIGSPTLTLIKPENETYFTETNLELNFSAFSADSIWYKIDSGSNITITGNTTFNTTNGLHTLYLFANNTFGNSSANTTFTINLTRFIIIYNNYANNGSTTNLNASSYEDIQNLSGIVLEKSSHGKISFNEAINLTNDNTPTDNILDLDTYTNVSSNFIEINTTALPNFNKSATLYLYNLNFTDPRILRNGNVCPSVICTKVNYSGGTLIFNVTQFSNYSADETPAVEIAGSPAAGGGGGSIIYKAFNLDKGQISLSLKQGEIKTEEITITNNKDQAVNFEIQNLLEDFIILRQPSFSIGPKESKTISIDFIARKDTIPDLYLGKIIVSSGEESQRVLIAIEVESEGILLDVKTAILSGYKKIVPGGDVLSEMSLFNLGNDSNSKDILIEYIIKDYEGNEIVNEKESLSIETQTSFIKRINIPKDAKIGNYILYVRAIYEGKVASSSDNFEIVSSKITEKEKIYLGVGLGIFLIIIGVSVYIFLKRRKQRKSISPQILLDSNYENAGYPRF